MKKLLLIAVAGASLIACQKQTLVQGGNDPAPADVSNVVLPPSITATKTYRCKDNSVVYIDWLTDGTARVKSKQTDVGTSVKVGESGTPSLKGDAKAASITYNGLSCKS